MLAFRRSDAPRLELAAGIVEIGEGMLARLRTRAAGVGVRD